MTPTDEKVREEIAQSIYKGLGLMPLRRAIFQHASAEDRETCLKCADEVMYVLPTMGDRLRAERILLALEPFAGLHAQLGAEVHDELLAALHSAAGNEGILTIDLAGIAELRRRLDVLTDEHEELKEAAEGNWQHAQHIFNHAVGDDDFTVRHHDEEGDDGLASARNMVDFIDRKAMRSALRERDRLLETVTSDEDSVGMSEEERGIVAEFLRRQGAVTPSDRTVAFEAEDAPYRD